MFRRVPAPTAAQLQRLLERISQRIGRYLENIVRRPAVQRAFAGEGLAAPFYADAAQAQS